MQFILPKIYIIGKQVVDLSVIDTYLEDRDWIHTDDTEQLLVEFAGRICYASFGSSQGRKATKEYIDNILKHRHFSVLEHYNLTMLITGVSRSLTHELVRHRHFSFCIDGNTEIYSERPQLLPKHGAHKSKVSSLWSLFQRDPKRVHNMNIRCLNETSNTFITGHIKHIYKTGIKPVFKITLDGGKTLTCTKEHKLLSSRGWLSLNDIVHGIQISTNNVISTGILDTEILTNGIEAYKDKEWLNLQYIINNFSQKEIADIAGISHHTVRSWIRKFNLQKPLGSWTIGKVPWNKGRRYNNPPMSTTNKLIVSQRMMGSNNHRWKGGITKDAITIRRPVNKLRSLIYQRDGNTCRLCKNTSINTSIHHIIPIWANKTLATDIDNLAVLCNSCHYKIHGHELEYVDQLNREYIKYIPVGIKSPHPVRKFIPKSKKIISVSYQGLRETYDLEMEDPHHNFIANGIVTHNSQASQRYISPDKLQFIIPAALLELPQSSDKENALLAFQRTIQTIENDYKRLIDLLTQQFTDITKTEARKRRLEIGRSILPNATATEIVVTANARALRHFLELRGSLGAEPEIRRLAHMLWKSLRYEAPLLFGDFSIVDGELITPHPGA